MGVLHEPGLYFLWLRWGPLAFIVNWFGKRYISICGSTSVTCAASLSTRKKARPWALASGTR